MKRFTVIRSFSLHVG